MSAQGIQMGARLAYVVVPQEGTVKRKRHQWKKGQGVIEKFVEEPAGFLVYFPRGHCIRLRDKDQLKHYNLRGRANIVNLQGLNDPKSPMGRLMMAQDDNMRRGAMEALERQVIRLAESQSGKIVLTRDAADLDKEVEIDDGFDFFDVKKEEAA